MPPFSGLQGEQRLLEAARTYLECFYYSVIPIFGDASPEKSKVAAVDWKKYQSQYPTDADFQRWFLQDQFKGLAIITGNISNLVVLDFDDANLSRLFASQYPHLADTRMVRSAGRGLPHYYFRLPPHLSLGSQKAPGVDLQSNGRYIVAPPTSINGREYKLAVGGMPYTLTANDLRLLDTFMSSVRRDATQHEAANPVATQSNPPEIANLIDNDGNLLAKPETSTAAIEISVHKPVQNPVPVSLQFGNVSALTVDRLIQQYRTQAQLIGRNQALFQQACLARDAGWTHFMTSAALIAAHVDFPAPPNHARETAAQRQHEAEATIRSAFSRPRRKASIIVQKRTVSSPEGNLPLNPNMLSVARPGLPGSLREKLLQLDQCHTLRVLDALLLANIQPGTWLTEKHICEILHNIVGRYSIRQALHATLPDGNPIFQRANHTPTTAISNVPASATPSPAPPTPTAVAADSVVTKNNKCLLFRGTTSNKNQRGRPAAFFVMPSSAELCARLGLKLTGSDALTAGDIANAKHYRQSLHREFLKRRPGQYSRKWLAQRLGLSIRSIQRYRQSSGISTKPVYHALPLMWHTLTHIPVGLPIGGMFIQSETGKRYPPLREIARSLLAKKERIVLMRQDVNHYSVPQPVADAERPRLSLAEVQHLPEKEMLRRLQQLTETRILPANIMHSKPNNQQPIHSRFSKNELIMKDNDFDVMPSHPDTDSIIIPRAMPKFVRRTPPLPITPKSYAAQPRRYYRQPLPNADHEQTAQQLYSALRDRSSDKKGYVSMMKARRLSEEFGTIPVQQALTTLHNRHNIHNPAGFVLTFLRSTAKSG